MARTNRTVPHHVQGRHDWTPEWRGRKMAASARYKHGLVAHEICATFRDGHLDGYSTATTGGKSTHRVKQIAGKQRRQHEKREAREAVREC